MTLPARTAIVATDRCALCSCRLETRIAIDRGLCASCFKKPAAASLPRDASGRALPRPQVVPMGPRAFSPADRSLIKSVQAYMPAGELLQILNDRLQADRPDAPLFTLEMLHVELQACAAPSSSADWTGLRQALNQARHSGLLAAITPQILEDFCVVFSLTPAAAMHLRDVITAAQEET